MNNKTNNIYNKFDRNGYVVIKNLFSKSQINKIIKEIEQLKKNITKKKIDIFIRLKMVE